jgi:hypothetical protein
MNIFRRRIIMEKTINILFEMATQFKFRYPYKGMITTEDLWDLSMSQLDTVYKTLNKELSATQEDGLIISKSTDEGVKANELRNKIEVVKHIFNAKQQAAELNRIAVENAKKEQHILDILAQKQENNLQNMSEEDLLKMLNEL